MTSADAVQAMKDYQKERKAYTDCVRRQRHKQSEDYYGHSITYSGCVSDKLQLMTEVAAAHIKVGQNFPTKRIMSMRFAEVAIQVSKYIVFCSSDTGRLSVVGDKFECTATKKDGHGWVVSTIHINVLGKGIKASDQPAKLQKAEFSFACSLVN